jgi:long-subunit fatty acid transport protein
MMNKRSTLLLAAMMVLGMAGRAQAGGYDTPILYSARHMGMGGAAASYVRDPSAMFHNPAGLANIRQGSLLVNASPVVGGIQSKPEPTAPANTKSETTFAPFFLLGGAYRITDWMVAGLAVYPVASAGAEYKYTSFGAEVTNRTRLMFLEASPGVAFNLPGNINLGAGDRITYVDLERYQKAGATTIHDFQMSGLNWVGFRLGAQWDGVFGDHRLRLGAQYRHKTVTEIENEEGTAALQPFTDISTKFILPTRIVGGIRYDVMDFGATVDVEYALNSQNDGYPLKGTSSAGTQAAVANPSKWTNGTTVRSGLEYRLVDSHVPVRVGYIWDQKTSNPNYPSAFGTPPGPSHVVTAGSGYNAGPWEVNAAVAYRTAKGEVTPVPATECPFCGAANSDPYELWMVGAYIDFSYEWQ